MITVLAGVNGAGKSSIGGSALRAKGMVWYNPDELSQLMHRQYPGKTQSEINGLVWQEGLCRLKDAVQNDTDFAFETTLGGVTITNTLLDANAAGVEVNMWYCGLESPELHIERVAARVARGGHDIPEVRIRSRYTTSMGNLCRLVIGLRQLSVYDNSQPLDGSGKPGIRCLLNYYSGTLLEMDQNMPEWARPVATACLNRARQN